jgi:hypothetical protein
MFETATITGIFYGTDGAAVTDADVYIVPKRKYLASVGDAAWVPRAVTGRTDASGQIGVFDGTTFTPGIALAIGQHDISVRKDGRSHNGVITVDADMAAAAGATSLHAALQPAPEPELISAARAARDKAREWAEAPEGVEVEPGEFSALHYAAKADADATATAADRVATGEDATATAADRAATGQDAAAAQASAVQAEQSALSVGLGTAAGLRAMWAGAEDPPDPWIPTGDTVTTSGAALRVLERFAPLDLFAPGESGAFYDPSDMSTLFQDAAGTIPVTGPGDPVGQMLDKSGNGFHASQDVSASRPTYQTDGTLHWLEFDGVDDWLATGAMDLTHSSQASVVTGVEQLSRPAGISTAVALADNGDRRFTLMSWEPARQGATWRVADDTEGSSRSGSPRPARGGHGRSAASGNGGGCRGCCSRGRWPVGCSGGPARPCRWPSWPWPSAGSRCGIGGRSGGRETPVR